MEVGNVSSSCCRSACSGVLCPKGLAITTTYVVSHKQHTGIQAVPDVTLIHDNSIIRRLKGDRESSPKAVEGFLSGISTEVLQYH